MELLAQTTSSSSGGLGLLLVYLVVLVVAVVGIWKVFEKAGQPGWAAIVPIYNLYIMLKIAGRPGWWILLYLLPFVSIVIAIVVSIDIAKQFGKSSLFGVVGLFLFSIVGYLMLGFGDATYQPSTQPVQAQTTPPQV